MKLSATLIAAVVANVDFDRKVPPRHPINRLARLQQFADGICHGNKNWSDAKQDRIYGRLSNFMGRMKLAFERDTCGFYNSDIDQFPHGGPDPEPEVRLVRRTGYPRKPAGGRRRRDAGDEYSAMEDACNLDDGQSLNASDREFYQNIYIFQNAGEAEAVDGGQDLYVTDGCDIVSVPEQGVRGKGRKIDWENASKAWRQLTTGIRKWSERYINNCGGMRNGEKQKHRSKKFYNNFKADFEVGKSLTA